MMARQASIIPRTVYIYNNYFPFSAKLLIYSVILRPTFGFFAAPFRRFSFISHIVTESRTNIRLSALLKPRSNYLLRRFSFYFYKLPAFCRYLHNCTASLQKVGYLQNEMSPPLRLANSL